MIFLSDKCEQSATPLKYVNEANNPCNLKILFHNFSVMLKKIFSSQFELGLCKYILINLIFIINLYGTNITI